jgi:hemoglobin-like flavoprotein
VLFARRCEERSDEAIQFLLVALDCFAIARNDGQTDIMPPTNPIERSFELAAERCEDLTPMVYRRLFNEHPEAQAMFRSEGSDPVKGSMLALTIEAILDFAGDRRGHFRLIECEVCSHDAYGTPRDLFVAFFAVIAATLRELLGSDWSPEIDAAWRKLLAEIAGVVAEQNQSAGQLPRCGNAKKIWRTAPSINFDE